MTKPFTDPMFNPATYREAKMHQPGLMLIAFAMSRDGDPERVRNLIPRGMLRDIDEACLLAALDKDYEKVDEYMTGMGIQRKKGQSMLEAIVERVVYLHTKELERLALDAALDPASDKPLKEQLRAALELIEADEKQTFSDAMAAAET